MFEARGAGMALATLVALFMTLVPSAAVRGADVDDCRLAALKDLNGFFPFSPPESQAAWVRRSAALRRRILVACGLWPMPTKTPLAAVIHGRVERPDFTVDRVILETLPGHYLCGSLFRPKGPAAGSAGRRPAVMSPHGHGPGRFMRLSREAVRESVSVGAERFEEGGRSIYQARCVQLARMGCVVFLYDMEGSADTMQLSPRVAHGHRDRRPAMETPADWGFHSPQAVLRCQSVMGLQTWNSIRALDFLASLPDVDPTRIGVTGESGGGTQTMILAAIDERPAAIVPVTMVSTGMQGGCVCENCSLLRIGTGNIEFAALFAPKPQSLIAADDWTREIMTKGMPELRTLYALLGAPDGITAHPLLHFPHNYNFVSRQAMYQFFNKTLRLNLPEPVIEEDYETLSREELTVWTGGHAQPAGGDDHERAILRHLTADADRQLVAAVPVDAAAIPRFRELVGGAVDVIIGRRLDDVGAIECVPLGPPAGAEAGLPRRVRLVNRSRSEAVSATIREPARWNGQTVVWAHASGISGLEAADGDARAAAARLLEAGYRVIGLDVFGQGPDVPREFPRDRNRLVRIGRQGRDFAADTYGFNSPLFVQRVHDILTAVAFVRADVPAAKAVHLVGLGEAGPWIAAAAAQCGDGVGNVAIDTGGFRFARLTETDAAAFVPGIVKYGDLPALLALGAPRRLWLEGEPEVPPVVAAAYAASDAAGRVTLAAPASATPAAIADWLIVHRP